MCSSQKKSRCHFYFRLVASLLQCILQRIRAPYTQIDHVRVRIGDAPWRCIRSIPFPSDVTYRVLQNANTNYILTKCISQGLIMHLSGVQGT